MLGNDLTKSLRAAAELAGCDHKTVKHHVDRRAAGVPAGHAGFARDRLTEPFTVQIAGWVAESRGKVAADVVHDKLVAMGYGGSARTTRRAVALARTAWRAENRRTYMPWVPEPGGWLQFDYGEGPRVDGRRTPGMPPPAQRSVGQHRRRGATDQPERPMYSTAFSTL